MNDVVMKEWGYLVPVDIDMRSVEGIVLLGLMSLLNQLKAPYNSQVEKVLITIYFPDAYDVSDEKEAVDAYESIYGEFIPTLMKFWIATKHWTPFMGYLAFDGPCVDTQEFLENIVEEFKEFEESCLEYSDPRTPESIKDFINGMGFTFRKRRKECVNILSSMTASNSNVYPLLTAYHPVYVGNGAG